jgi:TonB family protein
MGYTALLFCPDEKTARTVTQVLSELEFSVEACCEPFAAVKKLMSQHFDGVVVDCDNEQNATLLFKSARNSASNQTSLAVAVVEGQAGVAKAFRIGANLVLTKPINIEQAKGTLRVARGLLRKSEPAKAGSVAPAATGSKAALAKPASEVQPASPTASPLAPETAQAALGTPTPAWPAAAVASAKPLPQDEDLLGIEGDDAVAEPAEAKPTVGAISSSGAASAPAPAREILDILSLSKSNDSSAAGTSGQPAETAPPEPSGIVGSAPSFTFGGAAAETESSGGSTKIFIGIAAAVIVAVALYFAWAHFHGSANQPENSAPTSTSAPTPAPSATAPAKTAPAAAKPSALPAPGSQLTGLAVSDTKKHTSDSTAEEDVTSEPESATAQPGPAPLVVKSGKVPSHSKSATVEAPAPSVIGIAAPGAGAPPPNLIPSAEPSLRPTLQTLNVSQGVSQGLLIKKVPPSYPANALRLRVEGTVELMATISKTGEISHVKVISGEPQLTKAAADAVKQWKYKPYLLNGEPVEIQTQVTVNFKLPH